jgi:two-component system sensor histidine kinase PilS (NtrC family)
MVFGGGKIAQREPTEQELKIKIQFLMAFRVIIITTFLGSIILFRPPVIQIPFILPISFIIAATYAITIIYALLLPRVKRLVRFCYIQILGDLLLETAVVYYTGGVDSFFSFLYILTIITTSMILYKRGSYIAASAASIFFGLVVNLEFYKVIEPQNYYLDFPLISENDSLFYSLFLRIAAFYIVAILSGQLAGKLKETGQELEEKREDLIELRNFHENVVESIQMGLLTVDLDYKITSLNRYSQEILGIKEWETVGRPCQEVLSPEKFKELYDEYAYSRPTIHRFEGVYRRGDGAELHLGFTLSRLINEQNEVNGLIISFTDLSTIKALEEKMRRSERLASIGELASGMAHEVRNPLASISGSIEMLSQREGQDHTRRQLMEIVLKETERLNKIITDFLSYARPQPSRKELVNVNAIIKETMELLAAGLNDRKQIAFHTRLHEGPLLAMADSQELRQVLWNLCVNAVESMDGGGELRVSTRLQDRRYLYSKVPAAKLEQRSYPAMAGPEQYVAITVEDNGKGIRRQDLDKIFDPFYTTKNEGTGLGLSIAYRIVEKHYGFIDVESEAGKGTCISVFLPAGEQEPSGMGHPHQPEGEGEGQE